MSHPWLVAALLCAVFVLKAVDLYLLPALTSTTLGECDGLCDGVNESFCEPCGAGDIDCDLCHDCLRDNHFATYNLGAATCLSGVEYGLLNGFAFSIVYVVLSTAAGQLADSVNRVRLLSGGVLLWSLACAAQALCKGFWSLLLVRLVLGIGESVGPATSLSLLTAYFPTTHKRRGTALAVYSAGLYIGIGAASLTVLLAKEVGWRSVAAGLGATGVVVAFLVFSLVDEPPRVTEAPPAAPADDDTRGLLPSPAGRLLPSSPRSSASCCRRHVLRPLQSLLNNTTAVLIMLSAGFRGFGGIAIGTFLIKYVEAAHASDVDRFSVAYAVIACVGGVLSTTLGGLASDKLAATSGDHTRGFMTAGMTVAAAAWFAGALLASDFTGLVAFMALSYVFAECWFPPLLALLQLVVHPDSIGFASGVFNFSVNLLGSGAPLLLGAIQDGLSDKRDIRWGLLVVVMSSYVLSSVLFVVVGCRVRRRLEPKIATPTKPAYAPSPEPTSI